MVISLMYVFLAILGLSFLIFIHELGHYIVARRVGMRVETFSVGIGKPIYSWKRDGVSWQIGWLLFGGYVKIAGSELEGEKSPYDIPDGFFGKPPLDRIKVALAGPLTNLAFALVAFGTLWAMGGREKNFVEFTHKIGWVEPSSELYVQGIRPGDEVLYYDDQAFNGNRDHYTIPMTASRDKVLVQGNKVNYLTGEKTPFKIHAKTYSPATALDKGILTTGITQSANYIIYNTLPNGADNPLPEGSPMLNSGLQYGDRIVWVNGELVFSMTQLNNLIDGRHALLTIERGSEKLLRRVPRIQMQELKPDASFKDEIIDWQFAAKINNIKTQNLYTIPYNLTNDNVVQNELKFIDKDIQEEAFPTTAYSTLNTPLEVGDRIVAIDGTPVEHAYQLLSELQTFKANIIVERNAPAHAKTTVSAADSDFDKTIDAKELSKVVNNLGSSTPVAHSGNYYLLKPIVPKVLSEFNLPAETQAKMAADIATQKKEIEHINDPEQKRRALALLEKQEKHLMLGLPNVQDRKVNYNPSPFTLFGNVTSEIWHMLKALFTGSFNPKWMAGPIGIVQMVHDTSMSSLREALYWLGAISVNLGLLNLLPIPVLDGGTIAMSLFELITRKKVSPKTMEKLVVPFAVLLIGFFIFLTYNDLLRIFKSMW